MINRLEKPPEKNSEQMNAVIIHGVDGYPEKSWYTSAGNELSNSGFNVIIPQLPTQLPLTGIERHYPDKTKIPLELQSYEQQTLPNWRKKFDQATQALDNKDTILIGHSLGGLFVAQEAMRAAEAGNPYRMIILICPVANDIGIPELQPGLKSFYENLDGAKIHNGAQRVVFFVSDTDTVVQPGDSMRVANLCRADDIIIVNNGGHINADSGYVTFPALVSYVTKNASVAPMRRSPPDKSWRQSTAEHG